MKRETSCRNRKGKKNARGGDEVCYFMSLLSLTRLNSSVSTPPLRGVGGTISPQQAFPPNCTHAALKSHFNL